MDPLDAIRATFFEECGELLESLEAGLLALEAGTHDDDTVNLIFRAVHSIKGGAGAFDLGGIVDYAHHFESALDALRSGRLVADPNAMAILLRACDRLGDIVATASADGNAPKANASDLAALAGRHDISMPTPGSRPRLGHLGSQLSAPAIATSDLVTTPTPLVWLVTFEPLPDLLISGNEPLHLFRALEVLGEIEVDAIDDDLPALDEMDVTIPRLRWRIALRPTAADLTETEIEAVFEFALNLCILDIRRTCARGPDWPTSLPQVSHRVPEPARDASIGGAGPGAPAASIRVDLARVDRLVNLVGELVISQSMLAQDLDRAGFDSHSEATSRVDELQQLTRDMQDSVMAIRAQPVRSLFQRMTRIVREAAQATGKAVILEIEGEATEIDKTVVERLADPLTHMIRNAVDHGIETPDGRRDAGKPATGVIRLTARQRADRVVIEVADDGRGVDRPRVLERAMARGLVPAGRTIEDAEIDRLMFLPGFSTSASVSALSGRGVGLDVVQRAVRDLSGTLSLVSAPGHGCAISVSLPLTLAILDGMIIRSQGQRMVLPLSAIRETQTYEGARIERLDAGRRVVRLHERVVPLMDLGQAMGFIKREGPVDEDAAIVFIEADGGASFALRVDGIEAQRQVVIKGLSDNFGHVPCVSAATILGDGQVALIVDPAGIAEMAGLNRSAPLALMPEMMEP